MNAHEQNEPVENCNRVKSQTINIRRKKETRKIVIKKIHGVVVCLYRNKYTIKILFTTQFLKTYIHINTTKVLSTNVAFLCTMHGV